MTKNHLKRIKAPKTWDIHRKQHVFVSRPNPGGHELEYCVSLNTFLKEILRETNTTKETKYMLTHQGVQVNGKPVRDERHQVGFLDLVTLPNNKSYIATMSKRNTLIAKEVKEKQSLLRITKKTMISKEKLQINGMNGINILVPVKEGKNYQVGDSLLISLPDKKVKDHFKREKGVQGFIYTGKHSGKQGKVVSIEEDTVHIESEEGDIETHKEYLIVNGKTKPTINLS